MSFNNKLGLLHGKRIGKRSDQSLHYKDSAISRLLSVLRRRILRFLFVQKFLDALLGATN